MAEASVDQPRYFCHKCASEIRPVLPNYLCPRCNSGFIEQIDESNDHSDGSSHSSDDRRLSFESDTDPIQTLVFSTLLNDMLQDPSGNRPPRRSTNPPNLSSTSSSSSSTTSPPSTVGGQSSTSTSTSTSSSNQNPGASDSNRTISMQSPGSRTMLTIHHGGGQGGRAPPPDMINFLQQFLGLTPPPTMGQGGIPFPVQMFNMHGSPRDYAWGEGGLDAIITQLLNNAEGHGPPPATVADIAGLEKVEINNIHIEQSAECPVCKEEFSVGEDASKLPCTHFFHPPCVVTWLEMHNTCPVCRKPITEPTSSSNAR